MPSRFLIVAIVLAAQNPAAEAQQLDRRNRDEPEAVVEAGGRYGTCDVMRFSRDGKYLFAGGDDKVVRVWPINPSGFDTDNAQTLRWRAWREQRGGIKTIDVSADGKRVAVGGYGMRPATVAILDRETGNTLALTWPNSRNGIDNFQNVMAVAFHPDGKKIGFGTADGSLWLWEPTKLKEATKDGRMWNAPVRVGKFDPAKRKDVVEEFNFPRIVFFLDDNTLAAVSLAGQVGFWSHAGPLSDDPSKEVPKAARSFDINDKNAAGEDIHWVYRAELTNDRKSVVLACLDPLVIVRSLDGKDATRLPLPANSFPRSLAVHPEDGRIAVGVAGVRNVTPKFYLEGNDEIWVCAAGGKFDVESKLSHIGPAEAMAFHPNENRLAIAGGPADEVMLIDLIMPKERGNVVRGGGRRPWAVNISANGNAIGVKTARDAEVNHPNSRAAGEWTVFDLARMKPGHDAAATKWVDPLMTADNWTLEPDKESRYIWRAVEKGGKADGIALKLDRGRDQAPTCYTFLPAKDGKPTRVLVGHDYGVSLFELRSDGVTRAKLFTGHSGPVLSVVASSDQSWFISGGADHTVAAYSLADWDSNAGFGAKVDVVDGKPVVKVVDTGSPAWEAGLSVNDAIDLLVVDLAIVYDRRPGKKPVGEVKDVLAAVKQPVPGKELYFGLVPPGKDRRENLTTVRQRPLWKWFPAFDDSERLNDWVIWMWKGSYYHTTSANGDRLIGWHVNAPDPDGRPEFYQFQQFEKQFHKPGLIQKLVTSKSVAESLKLLENDDPIPGTFGRYEPAPVRLDLDASVLDQNDVKGTIVVRPRGSNPDLLPERVELWLNDYRMEVWPKPDGPALDPKKPFEKEITIPKKAFRSGDNKLTVLTFNALGGRAEAAGVVRNPNVVTASSMHGLAVGVDDYAGSQVAAVAVAGRKGFADLRNAVKDATKLTEQFDKYRGGDRFYVGGKIETRVNKDAKRKQLLDDLDALKKKVQPDDLLVIFFAGHGDLPGAKRGPAGMGGGRGAILDPGPFVFCCPDYSDKNVAGTSVSAEDLFKALAAINCRKLVLLDACHAGGAADANLLRRLIPDGQGPFVIAACDQSELSYEDPKLGHGLFTYAVIDALGDKFRKADLNLDGVLSGDELFKYVSIRVPELMQTANPGDTQTPICFPRQPPKFIVVKK